MDVGSLIVSSLDRKSATTFSIPIICRIFMKNWLMKFSCLVCRGDKRSQPPSNACSSGLWSVNIINFVPSKKNRKRKWPSVRDHIYCISSRLPRILLKKIPMVANRFLSSVVVPLPLLCRMCLPWASVVATLCGNANNVALTNSASVLTNAPSGTADHSNFERSRFLHGPILLCRRISISAAWGKNFLEDLVEEKECILNKLKEILKQVLEETRRKWMRKCFNCGKSGNFQRNCKAPRKKQRCISPIRPRVIDTHKASDEPNAETNIKARKSRKKIEDDGPQLLPLTKRKIWKYWCSLAPTLSFGELTLCNIRLTKIDANEEWTEA